MVCAPVRSTIPSLKLGDYLSVQAHKPCSISHLNQTSANKRHRFIMASDLRLFITGYTSGVAYVTKICSRGHFLLIRVCIHQNACLCK